MKISISNIAWDQTEEGAVAQILRERGIQGVEIAPTKIWPVPIETDTISLSKYREFWEDSGIEIVALQALLFGRPDLTLFENETIRKQTFQYLSGIIQLASLLGAKVLVFGSPKNRWVGEQDLDQVTERAVDFFYHLGEVAAAHNTLFCIEPNAAVYGCDFIRTAREGQALVKRVSHPGFGLHLDAGIMTLNGEEIEPVLDECLETMSHFHISEPQLGLIGEGITDHKRIADHLRKIGYKGWVSIEMRNGLKPSNLDSVRQALDFVVQRYGV
jgi:D-psicose/D-tagatose/L-ribulose 3-epimerase